MAKRRTIPEKLAAEVMFASDRTCCICRFEKHKCQFHHIDGDPANNAFNNLAVLCLHCHSETHSKGPFVRNTTPELVHLYNSSWREIIRHRLSPSAVSSDSLELEAEALLDASLDCHHWKIHFMHLAGQGLPEGSENQFFDVWDLFAELWVPEYTEDVHKNFLPLFDEGLLQLQRRFDRSIQLFSDVLPSEFRTELVRANRQFATERFAYMRMKNIHDKAADHEVLNMYFYHRFIGVIRILRKISRDADARRELATSVDQEA